jgi:peptidoglycan/xylan/chitin deacetylase (PgdA/CDA1 family)
MRLFRPGLLAGFLYPEALFRIKTTEKVLYLTFDDGPDPVSTPQLLRILKKYDIKVLFFCNGCAAEQNFYLITQIQSEGHMIGNHGYSHYDGWRTETTKYVDDVRKAAEFTSDRFFRPPFGRISPRQMKLLKSYKIVFWDTMVYDFDLTFGSKKSLRVLKDKMRPGSVIVLHDTFSSSANTIIEEFIIHALKEGYRFELLEVKGNG